MSWADLFVPITSRLILVAGLAALSACSYAPLQTQGITEQAPPHWQQALAQKQQLASWRLTARMGIQTEDNGGSVDVFWNQKNDVYKIRLIAAMGQGATLITGNADGVTLQTTEGVYYAENADELLQASLGINLPLSGLRDWLRAVPVANRPVEKQLWNRHGQLYKLVQDGWNIEMNQYKQVGDYMLPHRFYMDRDDQPELEIRIQIRQWALPESSAS